MKLIKVYRALRCYGNSVRSSAWKAAMLLMGRKVNMLPDYTTNLAPDYGPFHRQMVERTGVIKPDEFWDRPRNPKPYLNDVSFFDGKEWLKRVYRGEKSFRAMRAGGRDA